EFPHPLQTRFRAATICVPAYQGRCVGFRTTWRHSYRHAAGSNATSCLAHSYLTFDLSAAFFFLFRGLGLE
ncbi:Hypothetical predicted protein, partial [Marmota monax]